MEPQSQASTFGSTPFPPTSQQPSPAFSGPPSSFGNPLPQQPGPAVFSSHSRTQSYGVSSAPPGPPTGSMFGSAPSQPGPSLFSSAAHPQPQNLFAAPATSPISTIPSITPLNDGTITVPYPAGIDRPLSDSLITGYEVEGETADLLLVVAGKRFKVCSRLISTRSEWVRKAIEGKTSSLEVHLPLSSDPSTFLLWLHTMDTTQFLGSIKTFEAQMDLLALGVYFQLDQELHFEAKVLCQALPTSFNYHTAMPACWDRAFIPLPLVIRVLSLYRSLPRQTFGFGTSQPPCAAQMALEWLGERRCFSPKEIQDLRESSEFQGMKRVLQEHYCLPTSIQDYLALAKRYPVAIDVFTIGDMFRSLNFI